MKIKLILLVALLVACVGGEVQYQAPELPADLCMEYDVSKSLIRRVAVENNIALNQIYYGLIDATAIAMVTDVFEKEQVKFYREDIILFMHSRPSMSYTYLISHMIDPDQWGDKWPLIEGILFRRITIFNSSFIISQHDRCLILAGLNGAITDLYL